MLRSRVLGAGDPGLHSTAEPRRLGGQKAGAREGERCRPCEPSAPGCARRWPKRTPCRSHSWTHRARHRPALRRDVPAGQTRPGGAASGHGSGQAVCRARVLDGHQHPAPWRRPGPGAGRVCAWAGENGGRSRVPALPCMDPQKEPEVCVAWRCWGGYAGGDKGHVRVAVPCSPLDGESNTGEKEVPECGLAHRRPVPPATDAESLSALLVLRWNCSGLRVTLRILGSTVILGPLGDAGAGSCFWPGVSDTQEKYS